MKKEAVLRFLQQLNWEGGLTRDDLMRQVRDLKNKDVDLETLYLNLVGGRVYFSAEEAIGSIPESVWER